MKRFLFGITLLLAMVSGSALYAQSPCPLGLLPGTVCYAGVDENNAYYLIAVPEIYENRLVLWNHGYDLTPPHPLDQAGDLGPAAVLLGAGFAAAASSYRPGPLGEGGWAVADAAADTESLRQRFVQMFGAPDQTFVVGASEGGLITAMVAEKFGQDKEGNLNYHGSMPMCGPLAGGRRNWYGGFDLRVVYQYYCQNLPKPDEPSYPLYFGLHPMNTLTPNDVAQRINECTGVLMPPAQRSKAQSRNLANILNVTKVPESFLITDMTFATFALQELVLVRAGGRSPVTNIGVEYRGSMDDAELNRAVFRAGSDPDAVAFLNGAYDPTGNVPMPTVTIHTIGDGLVIVENEAAYREVFQGAGLFQTYTNASGHCQFTLSEFDAVFHSLVDWVVSGIKPSQARVQDLCEQFRGLFGDTCNFNPTYEPAAFETRIAPRDP